KTLVRPMTTCSSPATSNTTSPLITTRQRSLAASRSRQPSPAASVFTENDRCCQPADAGVTSMNGSSPKLGRTTCSCAVISCLVSGWARRPRPVPSSQPQPRQCLAVARRALLRRAHAGQHVLFDGQPVVVALNPQERQDAVQVDAAFAQFAEDPGADGGGVIPALGAGAGRHRRVAVLEVDVRHAAPEAPQAVERAAALALAAQRVAYAGPVRVVTGVEHQAQQVGVGGIEQAFYLVGRLDEGGA